MKLKLKTYDIDYEVNKYIVHYTKLFMGKDVKRSKKFTQEEDAVNFIVENVSNWYSYSLEQIRTARIYLNTKVM